MLFRLAFVVFLSGQSLFATSRKTPVDITFSGIARSIEIYQTSNSGKLPENFSELIEGGYVTKFLLDNARKYCDIENRYIFVDLKPMQFGNRMERILLMARQAGGEGDNNEAEDPEKKKGRLLIVEASDGSIQTRQYSEVMLEFWFEKAGLKLADYTFDAPPPPEYTRAPRDQNSKGVALDGPENPSDGNTRMVKNPSTRESKPRSPRSEDGINSVGSPSWIIWIAIGIAAVGVLSFAWVVRRFFLSKPLRKT